MLNVGLGVGFIPGMFYDRFGPALTSGVGIVLSVPIYLLIWSTVKFTEFYSSRAWLMSLYFLMAGFGSVFTYMVALNTNVINFSDRHTGKIIGLLNAFFAGSPSVFATVFYRFFTSGVSTDPANQDFAGFMLFFAVMFGVVNLLCVFLLRIYVIKDVTGDIQITYMKDSNGVVIDEITLAVNGRNEINKNSNGDISNQTENDSTPKTIRETLCNLDYHIFSWVFALASSVGLVYGNNITVTSKAVGFDYYNDKLLIIIPITNAIVSASIGVISDKIQKKIPRPTIVVIACISYVIAQALAVALADKLTVLVIATAFVGFSTGIMWSICPTIMKERFSVEHLGRNWGIAIMLAAVAAFVSQLVFGALYDARVTDANNCYGITCVQSGYGVSLSMAVLSLVLGILLITRRRCCHANRIS
ncbi:uncharacterized protein LOC127860325 isoform X2 [Dreissena polymorpha]|nr:uncharacterized protein LOC127860325 isoform X2 [Dreissena polymorpha]XP_052254293.1 uncharacterized protein LOC127860325 isoform X2 [Dreissena polymorpha]